MTRCCILAIKSTAILNSMLILQTFPVHIYEHLFTDSAKPLNFMSQALIRAEGSIVPIVPFSKQVPVDCHVFHANSKIYMSQVDMHSIDTDRKRLLLQNSVISIAYCVLFKLKKKILDIK